MFVSAALASIAFLQQPAQLPASPVARITVTPATLALTVGDSARLTAQAVDSAGRPVPNAMLRWFSGSFGIAVDSVSGIVRGSTRGAGQVMVVAVVPGRGMSRPTRVDVNVGPQPPSRIELTPRATTLIVGQRITFATEVFAANGDTRDDVVTWRSSRPEIVRVTANGRVQALQPGQATVTASAGPASTAIALRVVPNTVRDFSISGGAPEARTGDVLRFRATARDAAGREVASMTPQWSMAPGGGLVDQDGAFVAYEPGSYTLTATLGVHSADVIVKVRPRDVRRPTTVVGRLPLKGMQTAEFWPHPNGRIAYLSTIGDRIYALDISNPAAIAITDSVILDARHINDVMTTADGRWAVATRENASSRRNGIVVLDLQDPAHPKVAADYTETVTGGVHSAFVYTQPRHGTHVYLTDDATGSMRVIDLNEPTRPREIARWDARPGKGGQMLHDIDVQDGLAYLSYWDDGLIVLDVGNGMKGGTPQRPQLVSQLKYDLDALYRKVEAEGGPGFIRGTHTAWRHGKYVFVADEVFSATPKGLVDLLGLGHANGRMHVVDVSDLAKPRIVAWYEPDGGTHNLWVAGDTLYLGDYQGGLRVLDISGELRGDLLAQGREIAAVYTGDKNGVIPNASMAWGAFYHKGLVWVNDVYSGLWVVRVEPPKTKPLVP